MPSSPVKAFKVEEANALVPRLEGLLGELEEKRESFRRFQDELFFEELLSEAPPSDSRLRELEEGLARLEKEIEKIRSLGCILRHPERGLVDFLAKKGEEWVYFCWRRGEKEIRFYHTLQGGFYERKPLE